ncbi:MAG: substrate-binding domain-containing protein [Paracoccaceae bacterium]
MTGSFLRSAALGCALIAASATAAQAMSISLVSPDGSISVSGELLDFDGETYRVRTAAGDVRVDASSVSCQGDDCPGATPPSAKSFIITGSKTVGTGLMPALAEAFTYATDTRLVQTVGESGSTTFSVARANGDAVADIVLRMPGSTIGLRELLDDQADMAISARTLREEEARQFRSAGWGDLSGPGVERILALDGLLIVVAKSNPVRAITLEDAARVFSGEFTNWSDLGGSDAPITVYAREFASGTIEAFNNLVMKPAGHVLSPDAIVFDSDQGVSDAVADDPSGIGISSLANVRNARALAIRGACGLLTPPTVFAIKSEEYPLARRLFLYTPPERESRQSKAFIDYILSDAAQDIIADRGFVDQAPSVVPANRQGLRFAASIVENNPSVSLQRLREMTAELIGAERLSLTFRFLAGGAEFDNKARTDIVRFAGMLAAGDFRDREILLVGYSDSRGDASKNRILSRARADQVRQALLRDAPKGALDGVEIKVMGFGEMSPLRCNDTEAGRSVNRRVEVWLRPLPVKG